MSSLPRITVVTPSFNQAQFLETTMLSVLGQCYENLEYIVMDGGSNDGSVEIIRRHESKLAHWTSGPDGGQAAALNNAFARATGDIFCWLNSDDFFIPGALHLVAKMLGDSIGKPAFVYGSCLFFREEESWAKVVRPRPHDAARLRARAFIIQPSAFWTRQLWEAAGPLDASLHFGFDWDFFLRGTKHCDFRTTPEILSAYRFHSAHKSANNADKRRGEIVSVVRRHGTPREIAAYEFAQRNWRAIENRAAFATKLKRVGVPGAETLARALVSLPALPADVTEDDLVVCTEMFKAT